MIDNGVKSLSGHPLLGRKLVRLTYMDEAGTSAHEPYAVVCGAVIYGDDIFPETTLAELVEKHIPEESRDGFVFHTKDIWQGTKFFKNWPLNKRLEILEDLASIPKDLNIPIAFGIIKKSEEEDYLDGNDVPKRKDDRCHALAFVQCCGVVERYMKSQGKEYTMLIVEDQPSVRSTLKTAIKILKSTPPDGVFCPPLQRIKSPPLFAEKNDSPSLQIADICAFFARGFLASEFDKSDKKERIIRFWRMIEPQILEYPHKPNTVIAFEKSMA